MNRLFDRRNRPAWIVLLVCLLLTLLVWYGLRLQAWYSEQQEFELRARDVTQSIEERLRQHEQILLGGAGLFDANESVTRQGWHDYVQRLNLKQQYPGIQGVGFSQAIKPADLAAHIASVRKEGYPDYTVRPPGTRSLYTAIIYLEPFAARNLAAFGYDMMSEAVRAQAMRAAVDNNVTTISGKVKLVQETHGKVQAGFLMYVPVYFKGMPLNTAKERWAALRGFVYSPYRAGDLMDNILGGRQLMLDFSIYDGAVVDANRMYASVEDVDNSARIAVFSTSRIINAAGRNWTISLSSRADIQAGLSPMIQVTVLALGGGIGVLFFALASALVFRRDQAEMLAVSMTADIRANEQMLRQSEGQLQAILNAAEHIIISTDTDGIIRTFNKAAERYLGYRADEVIGKLTPAPFHVGQEVVSRAEELARHGVLVEIGFEVFVANARNNPSGDTHQWTYVRKDGTTFPVLLTVTAMHDQHGKINAFLGIGIDISERVKMDRMKSEFVSTVSHELRTPLTSIRGSLGLLVGGVVGELPAAVKPLLDIAYKNSERLILLVNDILDTEKIAAGKLEFDMQPVKLMPLLSRALEDNRAYAEEHKVSYELEGVLPDVMVNVDANRLLQVLANLLSNAAKFSPEGAKVSVALVRKNRHIRVSVKNAGPGIPEEFKSRIFQKFAQADSSDTRNKGGTGLGLSITRAIVEQMGGSIDFASVPDVMTEFYVDFPEWGERHPEVGHDISGRRVLICEDSRDMAMILRKILEQSDYTVDVAYDASQARSLLAQGGYAALMLDLGLPVENGIMLIRQLRQMTATADLPIIVVSGTARTVQQEVSGENLRVAAWLDKPFDHDHLLSVLAQAVH